jgi:hypothetical protein
MKEGGVGQWWPVKGVGARVDDAHDPRRGEIEG